MTSFALGQGIGNMYWFPIEHELVVLSQVFEGGNRVAQFGVFDITSSLWPTIRHSCRWISSIDCQNRWCLLTNVELDHRSVFLEWLQKRAFGEQDLGRHTAEVESLTRDVIPCEWKLMKFSRESGDDLRATELGSQLSRVESSFRCRRLLDTRVFDVNWAHCGAVSTPR